MRRLRRGDYGGNISFGSGFGRKCCGVVWCGVLRYGPNCICELWAIWSSSSYFHTIFCALVSARTLQIITRERKYLRLSSLAELSNLVLNRGLLVAIRAVVVAHEHVRVHVAHADEVVWLQVARVDARLVSRDAGVDDAVGRENMSVYFNCARRGGLDLCNVLLGSALVLRSDEAGSGGEEDSDGGGETHFG